MDDERLALLLEKYGLVELDIEDEKTGKRTTTVSIRIGEVYNKLLESIACRYGTQKSELIRKALDKYIFSQNEVSKDEIKKGSRELERGELDSISFRIEEKKTNMLLYKAYFNGLTISDLVRFSIYKMLSEME